jgi:Uma2 family endonuclease
MTQVAESPASAGDEQPRARIRAVAFLPSGRDDCIAVARMSFDEYLALDYEGGLSEWVDGEVRLYKSSTSEHQTIVGFLRTLFGIFVEATTGGVVSGGPYAMQAARGGSGREPDIIVVRAEHQDRVRSSHLTGPPDLVVEVISPDSVERDMVEKKREYEAAGVAEYWVIDARPGHLGEAEFFILDAGQYREEPPGQDGVYRSHMLPGFWIRLEWLTQPNPNSLAALREILGERLGEPA